MLLGCHLLRTALNAGMEPARRSAASTCRHEAGPRISERAAEKGLRGFRALFGGWSLLSRV